MKIKLKLLREFLVISSLFWLAACGTAQFASESFKKLTGSVETPAKNEILTKQAANPAPAKPASNGNNNSKNQLNINPNILPLEEQPNPLEAIYGNYKVNKPYQIKGVWYYPNEPKEPTERGIASWYGDDFHGKKTANGAIFDMNRVSAAHKTLPLPSIVQVTNLENGKSMKILVNDRGPYIDGRIIDLSRKAAEILGYNVKGTALVEIKYLSRESQELWQIIGSGPFSENAPNAAPIIGIEVKNLNNDDKSASNTPKAPVKFAGTNIMSSSLISDANAAALDMPPATNSPQFVNWQLAQAEKWKIDPKSLENSIETTPLRNRPQIFIQVGAFSDYNNSNKLKAILQPLGQVTITQTDGNSGAKLFRVRVGPIASVSDAEQILQNIHGAGLTDARIIVVEK